MQCLIWKKVELKLTANADMYLFFEKGKSSKKYLKPYDPKKESKHYIYLDANNLYGYAVSIFLGTGGFKWIDPKKLDFNAYTSDSSKSCVL